MFALDPGVYDVSLGWEGSRTLTISCHFDYPGNALDADIRQAVLSQDTSWRGIQIKYAGDCKTLA